MKSNRKAATSRKVSRRSTRKPDASIKVKVKWPKGVEVRLRRIGQLAAAAAGGLQKLSVAQESLQRSLRSVAIEVEPVGVTGPRFTNLDTKGRPTDGEYVAVHDSTTGLIWPAAPLLNGKEVNHADAMKECKNLDLLGHKDWRAPTVLELLSLIDYERNDPAVDPAHFKGPFSYTWSSTLYKGASGFAWGVGLHGGSSSWGGQDGQFHVRAVRAGQPLGLTDVKA